MISLDGAGVGVVGQVHPDVAASFGVEQDAYLFDITLDDVLPRAGRTPTMSPLSRFPGVEQDLALVVDEATSARDLQRAIASSSLVREVRVFDVYEGDQVPPGKKSVAFAVTYQAQDHTLTDDEAAKAQRKLIERLRREFGAELRGG
jgi:phenylalanyl-tRNA synthetase beta chain